MFVDILRSSAMPGVRIRGVRIMRGRRDRWATQRCVDTIAVSIINDHRGCRAYLKTSRRFIPLPDTGLWLKLYKRWENVRSEAIR